MGFAHSLLLIANWESVKKWFSAFFGWLTEGFGKTLETISKITAPIAAVFGRWNAGKAAGREAYRQWQEGEGGGSLAGAHRETQRGAVIPGAAQAVRNISNSRSENGSNRIGRLVVHTDKFDADKFRTMLEMEALG